MKILVVVLGIMWTDGLPTWESAWWGRYSSEQDCQQAGMDWYVTQPENRAWYICVSPEDYNKYLRP